MRRGLKVTAAGLGALALVLAILVWGALGTTGGARLVLDRVLPGGVEVGALEGRLWGPLLLRDVRYQAPGLALTAASVRIEWRPTRLVRRALDVTALHADTVWVRTWPAGSAPDTATAAGRPSVPLAVALRDLRVRAIRVVMATGPGGADGSDGAGPGPMGTREPVDDTAHIELLAGALSARADTFVIDSVRLAGVRYRGTRLGLRAEGRSVTGAGSGRDTARFAVDWDGELSSGRPVAGRGAGAGGGGRYALEHRLAAPAPAVLAATARDVWTDTVRWEAVLDVSPLDLSILDAGLGGEVGGRVTASGGSDSFSADVRARGSYPDLGGFAIEGRLSFAERVLTVDTVVARTVEGSAAVTGGGRIELGDSAPSGEIRLAWTGLAWPPETAAVSSPDGSLTVRGAAADFDATLSLAVDRADRHLGRWHMRARGGYTDSLAVRIDWSGRLPDRPALSGSGRVRYDGERVVVPELFARIGEDQGTAVLEADVALGDVPRGRAVVRWSDVAWPQAAHADGFRSPGGRVELTGAANDFVVAASADFAGWSASPSRLDLEARGSADTSRIDVRVRGRGVAAGSPVLELRADAVYDPAQRLLRIDTVDISLPETGGRLGGRVEADLDDSPGRATGRVRWQGLGWPLHDPAYRSDEGQAAAELRDGELRVTARAHLGGGDLPETWWWVGGHGDPVARFAVDSIRGRLLGGEVRGTAVVRADSGPAWQLTLRGENLDPGVWRSEWPGQLRFALEAGGRVDSPAPRYTVRLDSLAGTLRGRPVAASTVIEGVGATLGVDTLWMRSGEATVEAAGVVGDTVDATWLLSAETLADLLPNATGRLRARGRVAGPRTAPRVQLTAAGRSVGYSGWSADTLAAEGDVDTGGGYSTLTAEITGLAGPSLALDSLTMDGSGTRADHQLTLVAAAPTDRVVSRLRAGLERGAWTGRLDRLDLQSAVAGSWQLRAAAPVRITADSGQVGELCWVGPGELCLQAAWDPTGVRWRGTGQALPMAFFDPVLPRPLALRGQFGLETRGTAGPGRVPWGVLRLTGEPGRVEYTRDVGRVATQPYGRFVIDASSDSAAIDASVDLDLAELGDLSAELRLMGKGPVAGRELEGRLTASLRDSATVSRFVPLLAESRARVSAELEASGTVAAPEVTGQLALMGVSADLATAGIRLRDGELVARNSPDGPWRLEGGIRSDTGRIDLVGMFQLPTADSVWRLDLDVTGDRFRAFQTPELLISASPRLRVRAAPDSLLVDGELRVPRARIAVRSLESNVAVSPDVVILGAEEPPDSAVTPAAARADVRVVLGDDVSIDALGLTGRLDGQLTILSEPGRAPVGSGELQVLDGRYRIYRQTFEIDRGRLLYAGTPLTDPALDLRIVRRLSEVVAGMEVSGRATDPRVQLFSEPELSDDEVLAYLIVGRPLRRLSQSEGSQVQTVAASIGIAGGNLLLARLSGVFGLEQARLERTTTVEGETTRRETSLVLGRQILPRVQLDYVIGIVNAANVLRLRYMVSDRWVLQTESGEETGADLLYTVER